MGLFKKKDKVQEEVHGDIKLPAAPIKPRNKSSDDHLYSQVVSRSPNSGIMILISYTEEYFYDMIEFIASTGKLHVATAHTTYEEDTGNVDKYGDAITISHDRYYVLLNGFESWYADIYSTINNLSNSILESITQDLYEVADKSEFEKLIEDGILEDTFTENTEIPVVDSSYEYTEVDYNASYTDTAYWAEPKYFTKNIPNAFNIYDLMQIMIVHTEKLVNTDIDSIYDGKPVNQTPAEIIDFYNTGIYNINNMNPYKHLFESLLNHEPTDEDYRALYKPRYMYDADQETDGLSDQDIDDIFKSKYERFSAVRDNNVKYETIDEVLSDE